MKTTAGWGSASRSCAANVAATKGRAAPCLILICELHLCELQAPKSGVESFGMDGKIGWMNN
eukprot:1143049-Pelagomonas_calceolata.AAC.1